MIRAKYIGFVFISVLKVNYVYATLSTCYLFKFIAQDSLSKNIILSLEFI